MKILLSNKGQATVESTIVGLLCLGMILTFCFSVLLFVAHYYLSKTAEVHARCLALKNPARTCLLSSKAFASSAIGLRKVSLKKSSRFGEIKIIARANFLGIPLKTQSQLYELDYLRMSHAQ